MRQFALFALILIAAGCGGGAPQTPTKAETPAKAELFDKLHNLTGREAKSLDELSRHLGVKVIVDSERPTPEATLYELRFVARDGYVRAKGMESSTKMPDGSEKPYMHIVDDTIKIE